VWDECDLCDGSAVSLADPKVLRKIDRFLSTEIWPAAKKTVQSQGMAILGESPIIQDGWKVNACRSLQILIEDPARPLGAGDRAPWFCRMSVDAEERGLRMLDDHLTMVLALSTKPEILHDLVWETSQSGLPTTLHIEDDELEGQQWIVTFKRGAGAHQGRFGHLSGPELIAARIRLCCDFTEVADEVAEHPGNRMGHRKLIRQVNEIFELDWEE
jgi:hypothetical protein